MTIAQKNTIDVVGINRKENILTLMIQDDLKWDEKNEKLLLLQDKINCYLDYVRSGEVYKKCPEGKGLAVHIILASEYPPNAEAEKFLNVVEPFVAQAGYHFKCALVGDNVGDNADDSQTTCNKEELTCKEEQTTCENNKTNCCD